MANNVGVEVRRTTVGPLSFGPDPGDTVCIAVVSEKGPPNQPTLVTSFDDFVRIFGDGKAGGIDGRNDQVPHSHYVLQHLFAKGKARKRVWVVRVVEKKSALARAYDGTASGEIPLKAGGSPAPVSIYAKDPGEWGNSLKVDWEVYKDDDDVQRVRLDIYLNDKPQELFDVRAQSISGWGTHVTEQSRLVTVDFAGMITYDADSGTVALANGYNPAPNESEMIGTQTLDGPTGLQCFRDHRFGRGWFIAPDFIAYDTIGGYPGVVAEMIDICESFYRISLFHADREVTLQRIMAQEKPRPESPFSLVHYPNVVVNNEGRTAPAMGLILASWMDAIIQKGPGKAPAGRDFKIDRVKGLKTTGGGQQLINAASAEALVGMGVNPLWDPTGEGPRVMGARTCSDDPAWKYAHTVYLYNRIASRIDIALTREVYEIADEVWMAQVRAGIYAEMIELHRLGSFDGGIPLANEEEDPERHAFFVRVDKGLLTPTERENGVVRAKVWFKEAGTAETILVDIAKRVRG